jgi:hypothetical protein
MNEDAERLLAAAPPPTAALARQVCERILAIFPDAAVTTDEQRIAFGRRAGYKGLVFVVSAHRSHVTLGIAGGAGLPDPAGLMEGAGKVHRHVKLRDPADLVRPELGALMMAALSRAD